VENVAQLPRLAARIQDISVVYGSGAAAVHAVRDVSLDVHYGEVLLMMGPSGSGKSTLLQVLGCIRHATRGTVRIGSEAVCGLSGDALSRLRLQKIGFIFQHYNLLPSLCAWENVALALELRGMVGDRIEHSSRDILSDLGMNNRADAYPAELSGGERQRVAVARALVGEPDLILADEPTASLDAASGSQVGELLVRIAHEHGRAVVVVTHDLRLNRIADRMLVLEDGVIHSIHDAMPLKNRIVREIYR
jgi:putative ABC transport system ATP-binding protein